MNERLSQGQAYNTTEEGTMSRHLMTLVPATLLAGFMVAACDTGDRDRQVDLGGEPLATVNGQPVSSELLNAMVRQYPGADLESLRPEQREQLVEHLINLAALAQAAEREGLHEDLTVRATVELHRQQALAERLVRTHAERNPIDEEALRAEYEVRHGEPMIEYHARHILVETADEARELIAQLDAGADFQALAREHSTGPSGPDGGDLGWFGPDQMVESFSRAVADMEAGSHSEAPVETRFGWHVIRLEDTRESSPPAFEEVRDELKEILEEMQIRDYLDRIRNEAAVER
jgi:peptidyl-prolyl cis-trans isomerase C